MRILCGETAQYACYLACLEIQRMSLQIKKGGNGSPMAMLLLCPFKAEARLNNI
jgi:hypothetical protein